MVGIIVEQPTCAFCQQCRQSNTQINLEAE
jgi:hypothetical protein